MTKFLNATATTGAMAPFNTTIVTGGAKLIGLLISFKDVLISSEDRNYNWKTPEMMQALSQSARNPESHFTIMT